MSIDDGFVFSFFSPPPENFVETSKRRNSHLCKAVCHTINNTDVLLSRALRGVWPRREGYVRVYTAVGRYLPCVGDTVVCSTRWVFVFGKKRR